MQAPQAPLAHTRSIKSFHSHRGDDDQEGKHFGDNEESENKASSGLRPSDATFDSSTATAALTPAGANSLTTITTRSASKRKSTRSEDEESSTKRGNLSSVSAPSFASPLLPNGSIASALPLPVVDTMSSRPLTNNSSTDAAVGREEEIFAYSVTAAELFRQKTREEKCKFRDGFIQACNSTGFDKFTRQWGLIDAKFQINTHANPGNVVYDRFFESCLNLPDMSTLALAFHGTNEANVANILQKGLDPAKRNGQAYGKGEYFGVEPGISTAYCRGGKKMIVFIVVVPLKTVGAAAEAATHTEKNCPWNMVVVPTAEHQLPLGVLSFASVCPNALQRSTVAQQKLQQLSLELRKASEEASVAKVKAKIIQTYIQQSIDVAGELYVKNKDFLCDTSKKEISKYLHSVEDEGVISYYFPDLPDPMSAEEYAEANVKTVDQLEDTVAKSKLELARASQDIKIPSA